MKIQEILIELKKDGWWFDEEFIRNNEDMLQSIADKTIALQLQQTGVSISLERAKKYARHQHYVGTKQREFVEFEDWAKD